MLVGGDYYTIPKSCQQLCSFFSWSLQATSRVPTCCELSQSGKHGYSIEVPWSCPIMFHSYPLSWNQTVFKQLGHWVSVTCFQDFPTYGLPLRPVAFSMGLKGSPHLDIDASLFYLRFGPRVTVVSISKAVVNMTTGMGQIRQPPQKSWMVFKWPGLKR